MVEGEDPNFYFFAGFIMAPKTTCCLYILISKRNAVEIKRSRTFHQCHGESVKLQGTAQNETLFSKL